MICVHDFETEWNFFVSRTCIAFSAFWGIRMRSEWNCDWIAYVLPLSCSWFKNEAVGAKLNHMRMCKRSNGRINRITINWYRQKTTTRISTHRNTKHLQPPPSSQPPMLVVQEDSGKDKYPGCQTGLTFLTFLTIPHVLNANPIVPTFSQISPENTYY